MSTRPYLSVIIPAYREGERIGRTLLEIEEYFNKKTYSYEIIVVVDGSSDNTAEVARNYGSQVKNLRVIENTTNRGKGFVVKQGLLEAAGEYRLFMDADGSTSITHADKFLETFEKQKKNRENTRARKTFGLVMGSRQIAGAFIQIHQPKYRELLGDMGNWAIRLALGLWKYPDTQCGFKMLRADVAEEVARRMRVDRFGFDFEMIVITRYLGFGVAQIPVRWMNEEGSTVKLFGPNGYMQVFVDLAKTRWRLLTGVYRHEYADQRLPVGSPHD